MTLYMQPAQDLSVEDRVSRTQYQYTLEDPDQSRAESVWTGNQARTTSFSSESLSSRTSPPTSRSEGQATSGLVHRPRHCVCAWESRLTMIDQTLYDAFGQRQISTLYTQLNQYHIILETMPDFQKDPAKFGDIYVRTAHDAFLIEY